MDTSLEVFVDGHTRKITGAVEESNTSDIITALANAVNRTGRFSLVLLNRTNNMQYFLRTNDIPYQILGSLKERGIDACLEIRDADQLFSSGLIHERTSSENPSTDSLCQSNQYQEDKIYSRLPLQTNKFEVMLGGLNDVELEDLVHDQDKALWQHQIKIVGLEGELTDEVDREFLQLLKQRHNLRQTLNELNSVDWERQKRYEKTQLDNVVFTIERLKHELDSKQRRLEEIMHEIEKIDNERGGFEF